MQINDDQVNKKSGKILIKKCSYTGFIIKYTSNVKLAQYSVNFFFENFFYAENYKGQDRAINYEIKQGVGFSDTNARKFCCITTGRLPGIKSHVRL